MAQGELVINAWIAYISPKWYWSTVLRNGEVSDWQPMAQDAFAANSWYDFLYMCNSCECILFPLKDAMPSTQPAGRLVKDQEKSHARQNSQLVVRFLRCSHLTLIRLMFFYVLYEDFYALERWFVHLPIWHLLVLVGSCNGQGNFPYWKELFHLMFGSTIGWTLGGEEESGGGDSEYGSTRGGY